MPPVSLARPVRFVRRALWRGLGGAVCGAVCGARVASAQTPAEPPVPTFAPDAGALVSVGLTPGGFGVGVAHRAPLGPDRYRVLGIAVAGVADARETRFRGTNGTLIPSKFEYLLVVPARVGVEQRLFRARVDDNVRLFARAALGPTLGLAQPYFGDCNANQQLDRAADCNRDGTVAPGEGEAVYKRAESLRRARLLVGVGGTLAAGAHVSTRRRGLRTLALALHLDYLPQGVHLLEPAVRPAQRLFASPEVSIGLRLF